MRRTGAEPERRNSRILTMTNLSSNDSVSQPQTKRDLPWFKFFAKDWITDTASLSLPARGALITMLSHEWASGGWGEVEESVIVRILGCTSEEWRAVVGELWPLFSKMVRELLQYRAEKQAEVTERAKAGSKGGRASAARRASAQASATSLLEQNPTDTDTDTDTERKSVCSVHTHVQNQTHFPRTFESPTRYVNGQAQKDTMTRC
jgi:uncharacterized protein YdaU (DUF1376 family)